LTPRLLLSAGGCLLEEKLGIRGKFAQDVNAACSGFLYGLETARAIVALHPEAKVLLCAAEGVDPSRTNWADRATCVLFGDGAGAMVITGEPGPDQAHIVDARIHSDGSLGHLLTVKGGGSAAPLKLGDTVDETFFVQMAGQEVFKNAVSSMVGVCEEVLEASGVTTADIDLLVPHQANLRIIERGRQEVVDPWKDSASITIDRYGNSSASSVGIALAEARAPAASCRAPRCCWLPLAVVLPGALPCSSFEAVAVWPPVGRAARESGAVFFVVDRPVDDGPTGNAFDVAGRFG